MSGAAACAYEQPLRDSIVVFVQKFLLLVQEANDTVTCRLLGNHRLGKFRNLVCTCMLCTVGNHKVHCKIKDTRISAIVKRGNSNKNGVGMFGT